MSKPDKHAVDELTEQQAAVDDAELEPQQKLEARDRIRKEFDERLETGPRPEHSSA